MTGSKRRPRQGNQQANATPADERHAILLRDFRGDLVYWIGSDPRIALRIMRLVEEILKDPFAGMGKPEPLKHHGSGKWSRRITDEDRIVYSVTKLAILFSHARHHYGRR